MIIMLPDKTIPTDPTVSPVRSRKASFGKAFEEGKSISDSLDKSGLFPPMVTGMIAIGEEAGTLPELLDKVAEFYEEDVETTSRNLGSIIEPIALIGIGGLVGAMLISLYLPIFTASTSIGS